MEDSFRASLGKALASHEESESGWTAYLEDFSENRDNSSCSSFYSPSLVSDAASPVVWKTQGKDCHVLGQSSPVVSSVKTPKKLRYNKKRAKDVSDDDSLEDTASSPVNSPKVGQLKSTYMDSRKTEDHGFNSLLGKASTSEHSLKLDSDERDGMSFDGKKTCMDLKEKGLCVVPLSTILNYFG